MKIEADYHVLGSGIAAVVDAADSVASHARDTLAAGWESS